MNTALFQQEMANIEEYAQTLCETLEENFEQDSLDTYRAMQMEKDTASTLRRESRRLRTVLLIFTSLSYRKDASILRSSTNSLMTWVLIHHTSTEMVQYMHS